MANGKYSLFTGDVNGRLSEVFGKISELNKKHNFAFVVVAGNLFADPETSGEAEKADLEKLVKGGIEIPITTYFSLGTRSLPAEAVEKLEADDGELCPNLFALGRRATVKTSDGFKIVAVGGKYAPGTDEPMSSYEATFNDVDVQTAGKDIDQADILITSEWPEAVQNLSKQLYKGRASKGVQSVADLCSRLKPRYHFSASEAYFEREPFFQPGESPRHITRFISLAPFGNVEKHKSLGAYSLEPSQPPPQTMPEGCTESPLVNKKRPRESQQDSFNNFRYANGNGDDHYGRGSGRRQKRRKDTYVPPTPDSCYFCLSNRKAETHMVTSLADVSYVTVAKGPLTTSQTFPELGFPCHMLIIPFSHSPTIATIPEEDRESSLKEMQQYRAGLQQMVATKSKSQGQDSTARLGAVTYEISKASGVHLHWQFLPVPVDIINRGLVEAGFEVEAENKSYPKFAKGEAETEAAKQGDYFKVMIWTETFEREMVLPIDSITRFDLQFGRRVLAKLMGLDSRTDWRACAQTTEEETADAEAFKEEFKAYDFTA